MISSKEYVIKTMVSLLANPKKKYSQNFLIDYETVQKSVGALTEEQVIIEIGPGLGALTEELINLGKTVYAYEIDDTMINHLTSFFQNKEKFHLIKGDFMKQKLVYNEPISFISNIPYSLTTPIIEKVITSKLNIKYFVFMLQKEAGMRISAKRGSKDYGPLPIFLSYLGKLDCVCKVTRDKFLPAPNVDSVVMKLSFNEERDYDFEKKLWSLLRKSFSMRRKTLLNNLKSYKDKEELITLLKELNLKETVRPEELDLCDYLRLLEKM